MAIRGVEERLAEGQPDPAGRVAEAPRPGDAPPRVRMRDRLAGSQAQRRRLSWIAGAAVLALLIVMGGLWTRNHMIHVHVVDSRIAADTVVISSRQAGWISALNVISGDTVKQGQVLVELAQTQAQLRIEETMAQIERIEAEGRRLDAERDLIGQTTAGLIESARSKLSAAEAQWQAREANLELAASDLRRIESLAARKVVSAQRLEEAQNRLSTAKQEALSAQSAVAGAKADLSNAEAERARVDLIDQQLSVVGAEFKALQARLEQLKVELNDRVLESAFDGVIDKTFVSVGEYVMPGTRLLMYHDPGKVWIDANIKETQIRKIELGAHVEVKVDAYPGRTFTGKVFRIGQAATSEFTLLPTPNPSGNFTKITQRLPVRIALDQEEGLLRPGMMVTVSIDVAAD